MGPDGHPGVRGRQHARVRRAPLLRVRAEAVVRPEPDPHDRGAADGAGVFPALDVGLLVVAAAPLAGYGEPRDDRHVHVAGVQHHQPAASARAAVRAPGHHQGAALLPRDATRRAGVLVHRHLPQVGGRHRRGTHLPVGYGRAVRGADRHLTGALRVLLRRVPFRRAAVRRVAARRREPEAEGARGDLRARSAAARRRRGVAGGARRKAIARRQSSSSAWTSKECERARMSLARRRLRRRATNSRAFEGYGGGSRTTPGTRALRRGRVARSRGGCCWAYGASVDKSCL